LTLLFLLLVVDLVFTFFTFGQEVEVEEKLKKELNFAVNKKLQKRNLGNEGKQIKSI
jgi:hypothetical protein